MLKPDAKELIKAARERSGLSQFELANESGISIWTISDLETGRAKNPSRRTMAKVVAPLPLTLDDVFVEEPDEVAS